MDNCYKWTKKKLCSTTGFVLSLREDTFELLSSLYQK